jgi:hypothetical protein
MRGLQRVKTVPFARLRQAANCACVAARELQQMQSGLGQIYADGRESGLDQIKAIASNRLLDGPVSPA